MIHCAAEYKFLCSLYISAKQREKLKERAKSNFALEKAKAKKAAKLEKEKAKNEKQTARLEKEKMKNVKKIDSRKSSVADESSLSVKDLDLSINNQDVFSPVSHNTSPPQAVLIQPFNYTPKDIQKCLKNSMTEPLDQNLNKSLNPALNSSANWSQSSASGTNAHMTKNSETKGRRMREKR